MSSASRPPILHFHTVTATTGHLYPPPHVQRNNNTEVHNCGRQEMKSYWKPIYRANTMIIREWVIELSPNNHSSMLSWMGLHAQERRRAREREKERERERELVGVGELIWVHVWKSGIAVAMLLPLNAHMGHGPCWIWVSLATFWSWIIRDGGGCWRINWVRGWNYRIILEINFNGTTKKCHNFAWNFDQP